MGEIKAFGHYSSLVLFTTLPKEDRTFASADEILMCGQSSESHWAVFQEAVDTWFCETLRCKINMMVKRIKWGRVMMTDPIANIVSADESNTCTKHTPNLKWISKSNWNSQWDAGTQQLPFLCLIHLHVLPITKATLRS